MRQDFLRRKAREKCRSTRSKGRQRGRKDNAFDHGGGGGALYNLMGSIRNMEGGKRVSEKFMPGNTRSENIFIFIAVGLN